MQMHIEGLKGVTYKDNTQQLKEVVDAQEAIRVEGEVGGMRGPSVSTKALALLLISS